MAPEMTRNWLGVSTYPSNLTSFGHKICGVLPIPSAVTCSTKAAEQTRGVPIARTLPRPLLAKAPAAHFAALQRVALFHETYN